MGNRDFMVSWRGLYEIQIINLEFEKFMKEFNCNKLYLYKNLMLKEINLYGRALDCSLQKIANKLLSCDNIIL